MGSYLVTTSFENRFDADSEVLKIINTTPSLTEAIPVIVVNYPYF
jgi:hypothetical protein